MPCFPHPYFYSRISGRDSCKGGRFVAAPIWYPKIRAKFSLFVLHCIMAYIFKIADMEIKQHLEMKTKEAKPFLTISKLNAFAKMAKPNAKLKLSKFFILELPNCLGSSQFASYPQFSLSKFCQVRNEYENSSWLNSNSIFETKISFPKTQTKIMGSFDIIVRSSMNIFFIFEMFNCSK